MEARLRVWNCRVIGAACRRGCCRCDRQAGRDGCPLCRASRRGQAFRPGRRSVDSQQGDMAGENALRLCTPAHVCTAPTPSRAPPAAHPVGACRWGLVAKAMVAAGATAAKGAGRGCLGRLQHAGSTPAGLLLQAGRAPAGRLLAAGRQPAPRRRRRLGRLPRGGRTGGSGWRRGRSGTGRRLRSGSGGGCRSWNKRGRSCGRRKCPALSTGSSSGGSGTTPRTRLGAGRGRSPPHTSAR